MLGPRGTGKTLWCANQFPNALRVDLLGPATLRQLSAHPERTRELVDANNQKKHIVIDQILPELLEVVQRGVLPGKHFFRPELNGYHLPGGINPSPMC